MESCREAYGTSAGHSSKESAASPKMKTIQPPRESRFEESRRSDIAAAIVSLTNAKKALTDAQAKAQSLEGTQKKIDAAVKETVKDRRPVEEEVRKANIAADDAAERAKSF